MDHLKDLAAREALAPTLPLQSTEPAALAVGARFHMMHLDKHERLQVLAIETAHVLVEVTSGKPDQWGVLPRRWEPIAPFRGRVPLVYGA